MSIPNTFSYSAPAPVFPMNPRSSFNSFSANNVSVNRLSSQAAVSPFAQFLYPLPLADATMSIQKKNTLEKTKDFGQGFGKGLFSVLSMPWQGSLLAIGVGFMSIALPWAAPFLMMLALGIGLVQGYNAVKRKDWEKMGQTVFALLAPRFGGRWLARQFAIGRLKQSRYALPDVYHRSKHFVEREEHLSYRIKQWFSDAMDSFRESRRMLAGAPLENVSDPKDVKTIYQIAYKNTVDMLRGGITQRTLPGTDVKAVSEFSSTQASGFMMMKEENGSMSGTLFMLFAPGGPANALGMELSESDQEEDEKSLKKFNSRKM